MGHLEDAQEKLAANLRSVRQRMEQAAQRAGRSPSSVHLLAVTKSVGPDIAAMLCAAGAADLGENRVQDVVRKHHALGSRARWHLIGNLQKNKARKAMQICEAIHSVDSLGLLDELGRIASQLSRRVKLFVEVNVSDESTKHGVKPGELSSLLLRAKAFPHVSIVGLMTMPIK